MTHRMLQTLNRLLGAHGRARGGAPLAERLPVGAMFDHDSAVRLFGH